MKRGDLYLYNVEIYLKEDKASKKEPVNFPMIRNLSVTGGRIMLADINDNILYFKPDELVYLELRLKEGVNDETV